MHHQQKKSSNIKLTPSPPAPLHSSPSVALIQYLLPPLTVPLVPDAPPTPATPPAPGAPPAPLPTRAAPKGLLSPPKTEPSRQTHVNSKERARGAVTVPSTVFVWAPESTSMGTRALWYGHQTGSLGTSKGTRAPTGVWGITWGAAGGAKYAPVTRYHLSILGRSYSSN